MPKFIRKRALYNAMINNNRKALNNLISFAEWERIDNYLLTKLNTL